MIGKLERKLLNTFYITIETQLEYTLKVRYNFRFHAQICLNDIIIHKSHAQIVENNITMQIF